MKKFLALCILLVFGRAKSQSPDSVFQKRILSKTEIEITMSHYRQDGNNSAVTGGIGTEKLAVYAPNVNINSVWKERNQLSINAGADVITSASTDNIDFVRSSASRKDIRFHGQGVFERKLNNKDLKLGIGTGFSVESDYLSFPLIVNANYTTPDKMQTMSLALQANFDDLRWGLINPEFFKPTKLVYPKELRYREWYDEFRRRSFTLRFAFTQVMSKRVVAGIFVDPAIQQGLLATPFHRVYFSDNSIRVENFPSLRWKFPIGGQLNLFAGSRIVLKGNYQFYMDSFGINSHAAQLETALKVSPLITLSPFIRLQKQSASKYFQPYQQHSPDEIYYTSDYDLSKVNTIKLGMNFRFAPYRYISKKLSWSEVNLRYAWYHRSNGMNMHIMTISFSGVKEKSEEIKKTNRAKRKSE